MWHIARSFAIAVLLTSGVPCLDGKHDDHRDALQMLDYDQAPIKTADHFKIKVPNKQAMKLEYPVQTHEKTTERKNQIQANVLKIQGVKQNDLLGVDVTKNFLHFSEKMQKNRTMEFKVQLPTDPENQGVKFFPKISTSTRKKKTMELEETTRIGTEGSQITSEENKVSLLLTRTLSQPTGESEEGGLKSKLGRAISNPLSKINSSKLSRSISDAASKMMQNCKLPPSICKSFSESRKSFDKGLKGLTEKLGESFKRKSSSFGRTASKNPAQGPVDHLKNWPKRPPETELPDSGEEEGKRSGSNVDSEYVGDRIMRWAKSSDSSTAEENSVPSKGAPNYERIRALSRTQATLADQDVEGDKISALNGPQSSTDPQSPAKFLPRNRTLSPSSSKTRYPKTPHPKKFLGSEQKPDQDVVQDENFPPNRPPISMKPQSPTTSSLRSGSLSPIRSKKRYPKTPHPKKFLGSEQKPDQDMVQDENFPPNRPPFSMKPQSPTTSSLRSGSLSPISSKTRYPKTPHPKKFLGSDQKPDQDVVEDENFPSNQPQFPMRPDYPTKSSPRSGPSPPPSPKSRYRAPYPRSEPKQKPLDRKEENEIWDFVGQKYPQEQD